MSASTDLRFLELDGALDKALSELRRAERLTILYSGGVDSSLLAHAVVGSTEVRLLSVGVPGADDLAAGEEGARILGARWDGRLVTETAVRAALRQHCLEDSAEPLRSVLTAIALALGDAPEGGTVVVGQGADELFGGYAHFRGLTGAEAERRRAADWTRLIETDWPATIEIAARLGRGLAAPFVDDGFVRVARGIPLRAVGDGSLTKPVFRAWAVHRGVPEAIANRPKRAIQYGSGIAAVVRRVARVS